MGGKKHPKGGRLCPHGCGATNDLEETCDCQKPQKEDAENERHSGGRCA